MSVIPKVLIVDPDHETSAKIADALSKENCETRVICDLTPHTDPVNLFSPDLIIFDPIIRGNDPYRRLQKYWNIHHVPTLVISRNKDVISKVISLEMGADDYLVKPFDVREFTARVRALLRRSFYMLRKNESAHDLIEYPGLSVSLSNYTVFYQGEELHMPPKEIELLHFLASSPNQVFSREQLLRAVWGPDYEGDSRTVDVHIKRLRRKLPGTGSWSIVTVWGVGYRFHISQ